MAVELTEEEKRRLREDDYQNGMDGTDIPPEATPSESENRQPAGETQQRGLTRWEQTMASMNARQESIRQHEKERQDAWHNQISEARIRSLEGIVGSEGGRYSPHTVAGAKRALDELKGGGITGLRQHELDIADKGIAQERVKAWGMANQGGVAAGIRAGVERDANRAQHGYFDEDGNYVPGSTVRAAEANGQRKLELQENNWLHRNENTQILEDGRNNRQQEQIKAGQEKTGAWREEKEKDRQANKDKASERTQRIRERQAQQDALREQRDFEAFEKSVGGVLNNPLTQEQKKEYRTLKTPEELKAWWKSHFGRGAQQSENGAPKNGDRKRFKQGWGTWKDGKWVLDAQ